MFYLLFEKYSYYSIIFRFKYKYLFVNFSGKFEKIGGAAIATADNAKKFN